MFDYHLHSSVSFDSDESAIDMAKAAAKAGLKEICFTDHYDPHFFEDKTGYLFDFDEYAKAYDCLEVDGLLIRRGMEFGLTDWDKPLLKELLQLRRFDFIIGSVHFADGYDPYDKEYWQDKTTEQAFLCYLEQVLNCVRLHDDYDVLGHLTYVCKSAHNQSNKEPDYNKYSDLVDEIFKTIIAKGKGIEINTSGLDKIGAFLPSEIFVRRYKELGGEIVTIGSDAHDAATVGKYTDKAMALVKDLFGHVCTFEQRQAIFHKL